MSATKVVNRFLEILLRRDFEFAELQGGLLALLWGVWALLPYNSNSYYPTPEGLFRTLVSVAPKWLWGVLFLSIGVVQITGVLRTERALRRASAFAAMLLWLFTGILLAISDWHTPGFPVTVCFALGSAWGYVRLGML